MIIASTIYDYHSWSSPSFMIIASTIYDYHSWSSPPSFMIITSTIHDYHSWSSPQSFMIITSTIHDYHSWLSPPPFMIITSGLRSEDLLCLFFLSCRCYPCFVAPTGRKLSKTLKLQGLNSVPLTHPLHACAHSLHFSLFSVRNEAGRVWDHILWVKEALWQQLSMSA